MTKAELSTFGVKWRASSEGIQIEGRLVEHEHLTERDIRKMLKSIKEEKQAKKLKEMEL